MLTLALTGQTAYVRVRNFTAFLPHNFRKEPLSALGSDVFGGEGGIRTLAPVTRPSGLANRPLHHLGTPPYK